MDINDLPDDMPEFIKKMLLSKFSEKEELKKLNNMERRQFLKDIENVLGEYFLVAMSLFKKSEKNVPEQFNQIPENQTSKETAYCVAEGVMIEVRKHMINKLKMITVDKTLQESSGEDILDNLKKRMKK